MKITRLIPLAVFASASIALADDPPVPPPPPPPAPVVEPVVPAPVVPVPPDDYRATTEPAYVEPYRDVPPPPPRRWVPPSKAGLGMVFGGGVTDFINNDAHDTVDLGPQWAARLAIGTRSVIAGEAAYVGSTQRVRALGATNGQLMANGVEGLLRINFTTLAVQPYIAGGLGWSRYQLLNVTAPATSDLTDRADVLQVPAAAGLAFRARGFIIDSRFNIGVPLTSPALRNLDNGAGGTTWGVNANLGFEF